MTEKKWQAMVVDLAVKCGWSCYHTFDSRRSQPGFPDNVLWNPRKRSLIFAELKTDAGKLTSDQERVISELRASGATVYLWRPSQVQEVADVLLGSSSGPE